MSYNSLESSDNNGNYKLKLKDKHSLSRAITNEQAKIKYSSYRINR